MQKEGSGAVHLKEHLSS